MDEWWINDDWRMNISDNIWFHIWTFPKIWVFPLIIPDYIFGHDFVLRLSHGDDVMGSPMTPRPKRAASAGPARAGGKGAPEKRERTTERPAAKQRPAPATRETNGGPREWHVGIDLWHFMMSHLVRWYSYYFLLRCPLSSRLSQLAMFDWPHWSWP